MPPQDIKNAKQSNEMFACGLATSVEGAARPVPVTAHSPRCCRECRWGPSWGLLRTAARSDSGLPPLGSGSDACRKGSVIRRWLARRMHRGTCHPATWHGTSPPLLEWEGPRNTGGHTRSHPGRPRGIAMAPPTQWN